MIVVRDVRERGRDIEGIIKQWFGFVKPNFEKVHLPSQECQHFTKNFPVC
jgi:uridine kinase